MAPSPSWVDRLRIERVVWTLDQRLYDLPRSARIAHRREVRENLLEAAHDIGGREAIRRLGNSRQLAAEYRAAEFGDGPRHSWVATGVAVATAVLLMTSWLNEAIHAFGDGVRAGQPHATGTFTWAGFRYVQSGVTYTFTDGQWTSTGGAFTPLTWILLAALAVASGRLWRLLPSRGQGASREAASQRG